MSARRTFLVLACLFGTASAQPLTLPDSQRPEWLRQDGIIMAGSWEPLLFRVRRDGDDYTPSAQQRAAYLREHSPETIARLKELGVNFVMMHCYKGAGREAERESMADAVRFSQRCHDNGLRVGVYVCSGAFLWKPFFREVPEAADWVVRDERGKPRMYGGGRIQYRYYWNRNHPDAAAFYRGIVRFAVDQIRTDLLHFDNYSVGPGYDACSVDRFRDDLSRRFSPRELAEMGVEKPGEARPPSNGSPDLLRYAWDDFRCRSLADSYWDMSRFARSLRKGILVECNPGGVGLRITPPKNHGLLLQGGEAFWDEGRAPGFADGALRSRIRTYKVARALRNMAFCYTTSPLEMAESMAFNRDSLGAVCWFEYGDIVKRPGSKDTVDGELRSFINFFRSRGDLLRPAEVIADAAVLRSFASQVFADPKHSRLTAQVEEALIGNRACFQIIYDQQLDRLGAYRALVLAGCVAMSDQQVERIRAFVESGGRLCIIGPAATHDQWMRPRRRPALEDLPQDAVTRVTETAETGEVLAAVSRACGDRLSLQVKARPGLCAELTEQPGRRLVHLVNYRPHDPESNVAVGVRLPAGRRAASVALASPQHKRDLSLPFRQERDLVLFRVPKVDVYEIAVVQWR